MDEIVRKIPVTELMDLLNALYQNGVDFIDISKSPLSTVENGDTLRLTWYKEYMDEEYRNEFDKDDDETNTKIDIDLSNPSDIDEII